jgi:putative glutathione S-transferase
MAYMKSGQWQESGDIRQLTQTDEFNNFSALEENRFHLYVSYGCPFAHRAILAISLLGLEAYVSVSSVDPLKDKNGWEFSDEFPDPNQARKFLYQVYSDAKADYSGRVSVPVLWDKKLNTIMSNDSLEITLWLAKQSTYLNTVELLPKEMEEEIIEQCRWVNEHLNTRPFMAGFTTEQAEYEEAAALFFQALQKLDDRLATNRFYHGNQLTISDVLVIPTLVQFELVYYSHFKLNKFPLSHFKNIQNYLIDAMSDRRIASTFDINFIKKTYFIGQPTLNPSGIIPVGPTLSWKAIKNKSPNFQRQTLGEK